MTLQQARLTGQITDSDIRLLRIFRTVVTCSGFSAAEVDLGMSVAAISMAIADLEKRVGIRLCQRGRAGFSLTEQGAQVYDAALQLLASLDEFQSEVNSIHDHLRGALNIAITDNLVTMHKQMQVTNSLAALKRRGPEVVVNIRMMPPAEIEKSVLEGQVNIGVIPVTLPRSGLNYLDLYNEQSQLYCGGSHPLYGVPDKKLEIDQVMTQDAVVPTTVHDNSRPFIEKMKASATATDREGIAFLILSGEYIGFLPDHYAERWVENSRMRALLPSRLNYDVRYAAITRKSGRPNLVLETYLEELNRPANR
jgi:LysR family transcriptional regulator, transcriptional activator for bauABCD operon